VKDKKLFKKWWFWVIAAVILFGAIGSLTQDGNTDKPTDNSQNKTNHEPSVSTLPRLDADEYKGKEGLVTYKELKGKGYTVSADFEKEALTDINGKASDLFEPLDPSKPEDKQSVDAFVVSTLIQDGDNVALTIVLQSK
jgi:hypothetical protein